MRSKLNSSIDRVKNFTISIFELITGLPASSIGVIKIGVRKTRLIVRSKIIFDKYLSKFFSIIHPAIFYKI